MLRLQVRSPGLGAGLCLMVSRVPSSPPTTQAMNAIEQRINGQVAVVDQEEAPTSLSPWRQ